MKDSVSKIATLNELIGQQKMLLELHAWVDFVWTNYGSFDIGDIQEFIQEKAEKLEVEAERSRNG